MWNFCRRGFSSFFSAHCSASLFFFAQYFHCNCFSYDSLTSAEVAEGLKLQQKKYAFSIYFLLLIILCVFCNDSQVCLHFCLFYIYYYYPLAGTCVRIRMIGMASCRAEFSFQFECKGKVFLADLPVQIKDEALTNSRISLFSPSLFLPLCSTQHPLTNIPF